MRTAFGNGFLNTAYSLFLVLYVYAAAAYGLTRDAPRIFFEWGMGGTFVLWLLAHALLRRWPRTGILPWIAVALVLTFGWFVTGMAMIDAAITDERLPGWEEWFPDGLLIDWASYDAVLSWGAMTRTSVLLFAMLLAIDLWRQPAWARALIGTMVLSAFAMVVFFLLQRLFGGPFLLSDAAHRTTLSFATYRYWGNGAAYLNLFWPVSVAVAVFAAIRQSYAWPLWFLPAAAIFVASFLNVSKAGNVLAAVGFVIFAAMAAPVCLRELKRRKLRIRKSYLLVALIPIFLIAASLPFAIPWKRWDRFARSADIGEVDRPKAYEKFMEMLPDSGWVGFGPGTFQRTYRRYVADDPQLSRLAYWVAHQDYIQTAVEWGYLGTILWAFVLLPGGIAVLRISRQAPPRASREFPGYLITLADHLAAFAATIPDPREPTFAMGAFLAILLTALHALVDFPMQIASLQLYFLVLIALGWSYRGPRPNESPSTRDPEESNWP